MNNAFFPTLLTLLAAHALFFSACKTEKFAAEKLPARQIRFGTGGGFTGKVSMFVLLENGQIFEKKINGSGYLERDAASKKEARALFKKWEKLSEEAKNFQHEANFYYFLENQTNDSTAVRAVWGDDNFPPPPALKDFFFDVNRLVLRNTVIKN